MDKLRVLIGGASMEEEIANISALWATNQKSKDTLLSQTLKVEEKKVSLVF